VGKWAGERGVVAKRWPWMFTERFSSMLRLVRRGNSD
jgi:hypothetical protein